MIDIHKRSGYTVIPNDLLRPEIISARAWGVYAFLRSLPDGWRGNLGDLVDWFTESPGELDAAMHELIAAGYVDQAETEYLLTDEVDEQ